MSCSPPLASFPISSVAVFTADVNIAFACFSVLDLVLLPIVGSSSELYVYWGALGWDGGWGWLLCDCASGCLAGYVTCCFVKFGVAAFAAMHLATNSKPGHPAVPCVQ